MNEHDDLVPVVQPPVDALMRVAALVAEDALPVDSVSLELLEDGYISVVIFTDAHGVRRWHARLDGELWTCERGGITADGRIGRMHVAVFDEQPAVT